MKINLNDLSKQITEELDSLKKKAKTVADLVSHRMVEELTSRSPADTSQLVSSYLTTINKRTSSYQAPYVFGTRGNTKQISSMISMSLNQYATSLRTFDDKIFISNNVPYLYDLEVKGKSKLTGAGFISDAVLATEAQIEPTLRNWIR